MSIIIGGESFKGATVPVALMSLFPIYQTLGQLNSAVYFATGRTKLYRNIGVLTSVIGLFVAYLFIAPKTQWGLDFGSTGLALKMVLVAIITQNFLLWFNTKLLKIIFVKMLVHQLFSILIIGSAAGLATLVSNNLVDNMILSVLTAGFIYMILLMGIIYYLPYLFSTNKREIIQHIKELKQQLSG